MFCCPPEQGELFECIIKVIFSASNFPNPSSQICPSKPAIDPHRIESIIDFSCPIEFRNLSIWNGLFFINVLENPIRFVYVLGISDGVLKSAYCIVSQYLHIQFFQKLITELHTDEKRGIQLGKLCHSHRVIKSGHGHWIEPIVELESFHSIGLSSYSELAFYWDHLITHFPPYLLGTVLVYLLLDSKIIVISGSLSDLSLSIFAMAQMLYPIQQDTFLFPVQLVGHHDPTIQERSGPWIYGIHASAQNFLQNLKPHRYVVVNADVPYLCVTGLDLLSPPIINLIHEFHEVIQNFVAMKTPGFPMDGIFHAIRTLVLKTIEYAIGRSSDYETIFRFFQSLKSSSPPELNPFGKAIVAGKIMKEFDNLLFGKGQKADIMKTVLWPSLFDPEYHGVIKCPSKSRLVQMPELRDVSNRPRFSLIPPSRKSLPAFHRRGSDSH
jgi:hypothetical protein